MFKGKIALVGIVILVALVAAWGLLADPPAAAAPALGFTNTPTFTPVPPTSTPTAQSTNTATKTPPPPTNTPQPPPPATNTPQPPPPPQPTDTPTATPTSGKLPRTGGSELLGVLVAGGLVLLLVGARTVRKTAH